jgi:hypothetical protein
MLDRNKRIIKRVPDRIGAGPFKIRLMAAIMPHVEKKEKRRIVYQSG